MSKERERGTVAFYSKVRRFGFVRRQRDSRDAFLCEKNIDPGIERLLRAGDRVSFIVRQEGRGPVAHAVQLIAGESTALTS